jgi:hypothetical protein
MIGERSSSQSRDQTLTPETGVHEVHGEPISDIENYIGRSDYPY